MGHPALILCCISKPKADTGGDGVNLRNFSDILCGWSLISAGHDELAARANRVPGRSPEGEAGHDAECGPRAKHAAEELPT